MSLAAMYQDGKIQEMLDQIENNISKIKISDLATNNKRRIDYGIEARILDIKATKKAKISWNKTATETPYHRLLLLRNVRCGGLFHLLTSSPAETREFFKLKDVSYFLGVIF